MDFFDILFARKLSGGGGSSKEEVVIEDTIVDVYEYSATLEKTQSEWYEALNKYKGKVYSYFKVQIGDELLNLTDYSVQPNIANVHINEINTSEWYMRIEKTSTSKAYLNHEAEISEAYIGKKIKITYKEW